MPGSGMRIGGEGLPGWREAVRGMGLPGWRWAVRGRGLPGGRWVVRGRGLPGWRRAVRGRGLPGWRRAGEDPNPAFPKQTYPAFAKQTYPALPGPSHSGSTCQAAGSLTVLEEEGGRNAHAEARGSGGCGGQGGCES